MHLQLVMEDSILGWGYNPLATLVPPPLVHCVPILYTVWHEVLSGLL